VNYRHQRSERRSGRRLATAIGRGRVGRDEVVVATKGGFIRSTEPCRAIARLLSGDVSRDRDHQPGEVAGGAHCMTPRYLPTRSIGAGTNLGSKRSTI